MQGSINKLWVPLGVALILIGGLVSTVHAGPPKDATLASEAIDDARQLRDALQIHLAPAPVATSQVSLEPARTVGKTGARKGRRTRAVGSNSDVTLVYPEAAEISRSEARALEHAQRSMVRISQQIAMAEDTLKRNPSLALHRVDLALLELRKAERRLGIKLEVQP